jgi:hypothetical protein
MTWTWYYVVILCLVSFVLGYITKDQITDEYVSNVTIHKPKIKGGGEMDLVQDVEIQHRKTTWGERRRLRKEAKKPERRR